MASKTILSIDTNIIVHAIVQEPKEQYLKICDLLTQPSCTFRVFDSAIIESVYVFESFYTDSRAKIAEYLTNFFWQFSETLDYNRTIVKMVLPYWVEHPALSFTDCYLAFMASLSQTEPLMTLDKKLAAQHPGAELLEA